MGDRVDTIMCNLTGSRQIIRQVILTAAIPKWWVADYADLNSNDRLKDSAFWVKFTILKIDIHTYRRWKGFC